MASKPQTPGAAFEAATAKQLGVLAKQISNFVWRPLCEPARQIKNRKTGEMQFVRTRETHPGDFEACIPPDGHAWFLECKSTAEKRLTVGERGLKPTQLALLLAWADAGALAGVLWECRHEIAPHVWWIGSEHLREWSEGRFGRRSQSFSWEWANVNALCLGAPWRWDLAKVLENY